MKKIIFQCFFIFCIISANYIFSQVIFWTENFGTGCNQGQLANGYTGPNGTWTVSNTGTNGNYANQWYVSAMENGGNDGDCGTTCGTNRSLHVGNININYLGIINIPADQGAAYYAGGLPGYNPTTDRRVESPTINCTGRYNITLSFEYIEYGEGTNDNATLWYFDGNSWSQLADLPKTQCCGGAPCDGYTQGRWTTYSIALPASADNNPNVRIGFRWVNDNNSVGTDPSFAVDNIRLSVPTAIQPPDANFVASSTTICAGQCINFTDLSTNNPTSWNWSFSGAIPTNSNAQNPTNICYNTPGTYTVQLTASNAGGSDTETKVNYITVLPNPIVNLGNDTTICSGNSVVLNAGAGYVNYTWNPPAGNVSSINVNTSGTYSVTVTDANNCQGSDAIVVTVLNTVDATITSPTNYCSNGSNVNLTAVSSGGTWWGPGIINPSTGLFSPSAAGVGVHTIYYGISGFCGDTANIQLTVHQAPVVNLGNDTTICSGNSVTLQAGSGYNNYQWSPSQGNVSSIIVNESGTYSVTVTDNNNCQASDVISVTVLPQADATILTTGPFCTGDPQLQFHAVTSGGIWQGNGITSNGLFTPSQAGSGIHQISYIIAGICGDTATISITVYPTPVVILYTFDETCIDANDGWAFLHINGGTPPYQILWNGVVGDDTIMNLVPGNYIYEIKDQNGCGTSATFGILAGQVECKLPHLFIPNIFSPNGDGINDLFLIFASGVKYFHIIIYNRWGQRIFESEDLSEGWDGKYKGKECEPGVYTYVAKVTWDNSNKTEKFKGNLTLVR